MCSHRDRLSRNPSLLFCVGSSQRSRRGLTSQTRYSPSFPPLHKTRPADSAKRCIAESGRTRTAALPARSFGSARAATLEILGLLRSERRYIQSRDGRSDHPRIGPACPVFGVVHPPMLSRPPHSEHPFDTANTPQCKGQTSSSTPEGSEPDALIAITITALVSM
ncbi:hypothetical protein GY45DRAFT_501078 [Cubamyces sp. BRFM 1775]|nr:hypothetical protein GY45DRAFT_501078 [Cubamyces sp. BRFM 1775]